jgi:hypothetical protein
MAGQRGEIPMATRTVAGRLGSQGLGHTPPWPPKVSAPRPDNAERLVGGQRTGYVSISC